MTALRIGDPQGDLDAVVETFDGSLRDRGVERAYYEYLYVLRTLSPFLESLGTDLNVLDLGAGAGVVPLTLARRGARVTAVDTWVDYAASLDNQMGDVDAILRRFQAAGVTTVTADLASLPLPLSNRSQDLVLMLAVIEHLHSSPAPLFEEIRRVLRPAGCLVLTTPNYANLQNRLKLLAGRSPMSPIESWYHQVPFTGHVREFTMTELTRMLGFGGFEVIHRGFTETARRNTPLAGGRWRRGLTIRHPSHIGRVIYYCLTALVPGLRYGCTLVARRADIARTS